MCLPVHLLSRTLLILAPQLQPKHRFSSTVVKQVEVHAFSSYPARPLSLVPWGFSPGDERTFHVRVVANEAKM